MKPGEAPRSEIETGQAKWYAIARIVLIAITVALGSACADAPPISGHAPHPSSPNVTQSVAKPAILTETSQAQKLQKDNDPFDWAGNNGYDGPSGSGGESNSRPPHSTLPPITDLPSKSNVTIKSTNVFNFSPEMADNWQGVWELYTYQTDDYLSGARMTFLPSKNGGYSFSIVMGNGRDLSLKNICIISPTEITFKINPGDHGRIGGHAILGNNGFISVSFNWDGIQQELPEDDFTDRYNAGIFYKDKSQFPPNNSTVQNLN